MDQIINFFNTPIGQFIIVFVLASIAWKILKSIVKVAVVVAIGLGIMYMVSNINKPVEVSAVIKSSQGAIVQGLSEMTYNEFN